MLHFGYNTDVSSDRNRVWVEGTLRAARDGSSIAAPLCFGARRA
jgi:hypothetical protein